MDHPWLKGNRSGHIRVNVGVKKRPPVVVQQFGPVQDLQHPPRRDTGESVEIQLILKRHQIGIA